MKDENNKDSGLISLPNNFGVNLPISKQDLAKFPNHSIIETGVFPNRRQRRSKKKR